MHTKAPHQRRANYRQTIDHEYSDALALFEQLCTELHSGASPAAHAGALLAPPACRRRCSSFVRHAHRDRSFDKRGPHRCVAQ